jgi:hypothetical protein
VHHCWLSEDHRLFEIHHAPRLAFAAICVAEASTAIYTGPPPDILPCLIRDQIDQDCLLGRRYACQRRLRACLGGDATGTWQQRGDDTTFWPAWLSRDIPGLTAWTLAYDAPPTRWFNRAKAGMALQDRAGNVLEYLLGQPELKGRPLVFICHSLGGLVVKQVIRAADGRRTYNPEAAAFLDSVKGVVFIATPHTGSLHATLLDRLRLFARPSPSALDLVKNNANLRNLNVWYRNNWSLRIRHKVFYEKRGTTGGVIVADDSADPGGNAGWQRDLSVSNERLGDICLAQGNLSAAIEQYRASLARMVPIRDADPSNMDLQRFTSVTYQKIGDVLVAQGNLPEALKSFRDDLAITEQLARRTPATPAGSAICRCLSTVSATCWWRRAICRRR